MVNAKTRILDFLEEGNRLTTAQAERMFHIDNVSARIHELRCEGFVIYSNKKTAKNGKKVTEYRLGTPSTSYLRSLEYGNVSDAIASLYGSK